MSGGDEEVRITLRLPGKLRDRLLRASEMNSRSMNGEIVERLDWSFDRSTAEMTALLERIAEREDEISQLKRDLAHMTSKYELAQADTIRLETRLQEETQTRQYLEEIRGLLEERLEQAEEGDFSYINLPKDQTLYVALDANGLPLSWQEIMTHLGEIGRAGHFEVQKIEARVFDAKSVSNNEREQEWWDLVQRYRKLRTKKSSGKSGS